MRNGIVNRRTTNGVANEIEWASQDGMQISITEPWHPDDVRWCCGPPTPIAGGDLVPTTLPVTAERPMADPLWPRTVSGLRMRQMFLDRGERALCVGEKDDWAWWIDDEAR